MAQEISNGHFVQVTNYCQLGSQLSLNILYYQWEMTSGDVADLDLIAQEYWTLLAPLYAGVMTQEAVAIGTKFQNVTAVPLRVPVLFSEHEDGTIMGDPLPGQISGIISWRGALAGASNRGRSYIGFPAETDNIVTHIPSNDYMNNLNLLADQLMTVEIPTQSGALNLHIYSPSTSLFVEVDSFITRQKWATQRRRGSFGQPNQSPF